MFTHQTKKTISTLNYIHGDIMPINKTDTWSDERKLSAFIVVATAERIRGVRWLLSRDEFALVLDGHQALENGRRIDIREITPAGELNSPFQHTLNQVLRGLYQFSETLTHLASLPELMVPSNWLKSNIFFCARPCTMATPKSQRL
jgi:hypothetical protein